MHDILPTSTWLKYYDDIRDPKSPFFNDKPKAFFEHEINGYFIHPSWHFIGSESLFCKILYADYSQKYAVIELMGEWNDALVQDCKWFYQSVFEPLNDKGINHFVFVCENVFQFHGSFENDYYLEMYQNSEDGWLCLLQIPPFLEFEFNKYKMDHFFHFGGTLELPNWRTFTPQKLFETINSLITKRLN